MMSGSRTPAVGDGPPVVWAARSLAHLAFSWESPIWRHWTEEFAKGLFLRSLR